MNNVGCYIIYSQKLDRYYIGACQSNLSERIEKHNRSFYGKQKYTSISDDWVLFLFIKAENYPHAIRIERKIKRMKSRKYIENIKKYAETNRLFPTVIHLSQ